MDSYILIAAIPLSFTLSLYFTKKWIGIAKKIGFLGKDMNKYRDIKVPEGGGIGVVLSIVFTTLFLMGYNVFVLSQRGLILDYTVFTSTVLLAAFIGLLDDLIGWKIGWKPWQKLILTIPLAFPLMAAKVGYSIMCPPIIGCINFGILYPLLIVPIGVLGAVTSFNFIAGYNGLEAMMGMIIIGFLGLKLWILGYYHLALLAIISIFAILGFYKWNRYPAKVFPGDIFTYSIGSVIVLLIILGNIEKFGVSLWILYFIEFLLLIRGLINMKKIKENFGIPRPDGSLDLPYDKIYSVTHLAIWIQKKLFGKATEKGVVVLITTFQFVWSLLMFLFV